MMFETIKQEGFRDLLFHSEVVAFARWVLIESYVEAAPGYERQMRDLMEHAFDQLLGAREDESILGDIVHYLVVEVFRKGTPDFWFNRVYGQYKREIKPYRRLQNLLPLIKGNRILDFGCGDGLTALALHQAGYQVFLTDVLDYRDSQASRLPFMPNCDPSHFPFGGQVFDDGLLFAVLHHVESQDLNLLLNRLGNQCRRLIIEEDCFDLPSDWVGSEAGWSDDGLLKAFMELRLEDQFRYLMFVDYFANVLTQGIFEMRIPFNFRSVSEWQTLFTEQGFWVQEPLILGFQKGFFNRSCHVWFVLERT